MPRLLIIAAMLLAAACNSSEPPAAAAAEPAAAAAKPATPPPAAAPEPAAVKPAEPAPFDAVASFNTTCGVCHGAAGDGKGPAGAALKPPPANFTDAAFWEGKDKAAIAKAIKEGGAAVGKSPLMAAFGAQFNDEQIGLLTDHVMSFKPAE